MMGTDPLRGGLLGWNIVHSRRAKGLYLTQASAAQVIDWGTKQVERHVLVWEYYDIEGDDIRHAID